MFNIYDEDGLDDVLPTNAKVTILDVWGYDGNDMPSKMFDICAIAHPGETVKSSLKALHYVYSKLCSEAGYEPREAYGYESYWKVAENLYVINLGT